VNIKWDDHFLLSDQCAYPAQLKGPAAIFPDDTCAQLRTPGIFCDLPDHLTSEVVDGALGIGQILILVNIVRQPHHDMHAGFA
jgi:hypothetical protein